MIPSLSEWLTIIGMFGTAVAALCAGVWWLSRMHGIVTQIKTAVDEMNHRQQSDHTTFLIHLSSHHEALHGHDVRITRLEERLQFDLGSER